MIDDQRPIPVATESDDRTRAALEELRAIGMLINAVDCLLDFEDSIRPAFHRMMEAWEALSDEINSEYAPCEPD
jgi:hypothetical protein